MSKPASRRGQQVACVTFVFLVGLLVAVVAACGAGTPDAAALGFIDGGAGGTSCGTPNEGCPCIEPGVLADCGKVSHRSPDGYVACTMGHRQCLGGVWGACYGDTDIKTKTYMASGGQNLRSLGTGAKCGADGGGPPDDCDPYCNAFVDDPLGIDAGVGLSVVDGGLSLSLPDAGTDGGAPGVFQATSGGLVTCGGATNLVDATCTAGNVSSCQQDFHCDTGAGTCQWNGGPGYWDSTAGGPDLTVGAPCGASGSASAAVPVCNRGSAAIGVGATITFHVTTTAPGGCSTTLGTPTASYMLSQALGSGECQMFNLPNAAGNKFITVNAGSPGPVMEGTGRCANNSAPFKDDGAPGCAACSTCSTTLKGKVYDPSGTTNDIPLAGITVFQPAAALPTFVDGVACESCASLDVPSIAKAVTDATGSFTLTGVTPGANVPVVVQSGRWRRRIELPAVTACVENAPAAGTFRMPKNRGEGDIPRTAMVMSDNESLECLLRKIGIDASEFGAYSAGAAQRIRLFRNNGMHYPSAPSAAANLYGALSEHSQVLFDCDGAGGNHQSDLWDDATGTQKAAMQTYAANGGKIFMDHLPGQLYLTNGPAPFNTVSTWNTDVDSQTDDAAAPAKGKVLTGTPAQNTLRAWLENVTAMTDFGPPYISSLNPRYHALVGSAQSTAWIRGDSNNNFGARPNGNYSLSFSFEMGKVGATPTINATCGVPDAHGRVIFNGMHVSQTRGGNYPSTGNFPADCDLGFGLTPEEKVLEFQLFQLTACALGGAPPPPPPVPPPPLVSATYYRDYQGLCGSGERVSWAPFYWEGVFPPGTSIDFRAATAENQADLPASPPSESQVANIGTSGATVTSPAWDCSGCPSSPMTVDQELLDQRGVRSQEWLRVYMRFNPTTTISPVLTAWRQVYECLPAE